MRRFVVLAALAACGGPEAPARTPQERVADSAPAIAALQASQFDQAARAADVALAQDPHNARAAAVRAISTYRQAGNELVIQLEHVIEAGVDLKMFDHGKGREVWLGFLDRLEAVDRDLAVVAADPGFSLELCLACWEQDWNHDGRIDDRDRRMFELEFDGHGGELAAGDPRRRPTYRFDVGDAEWARAMVAFQRAVVDLVLAYRWSELDRVFSGHSKITIRLDDKRRVQRARELLLSGLDHADRSRVAYLAETDDDREWVPNPRQNSYAMPLDVDDAVYETWRGVIGDVRRLLKSQDGISFHEVEQLVGEKLPIDGYLDIGAMLREPRDIVFDPKRIDARPMDAEGLLRDVVGAGYRRSMKASAIVGRLRAIQQELDHGDETLERKLRFLVWFN